MSKFKVLFFFISCFIVTNITAQTNISSVWFTDSSPESYLKVVVNAGFVDATDSTLFDEADIANYDFTWAGDSAPELDSLHTAVYEFPQAGTYNINLTVFEKSSSSTFNYTQAITIASASVLNVPNVFTPNGDNINDLFTVFYDGLEELDITIFSKTGTKVYAQQSPTIVWDGRNSSGAMVTQGLYYYIIKSQNIEAQTGFVYVIYDPADVK